MGWAVLLALLLCPAVFEADGAVEDEVTVGAVLIDAEVADALELEGVVHLGSFGEERLDLGVGDDA